MDKKISRVTNKQSIAIDAIDNIEPPKSLKPKFKKLWTSIIPSLEDLKITVYV